MKFVNKITRLFDTKEAGDLNQSAENDALRELQKYSDKELADIGITRGEIRHVVKHGRAGIDVPEQQKVA